MKQLRSTSSWSCSIVGLVLASSCAQVTVERRALVEDNTGGTGGASPAGGSAGNSTLSTTGGSVGIGGNSGGGTASSTNAATGGTRATGGAVATGGAAVTNPSGGGGLPSSGGVTATGGATAINLPYTNDFETGTALSSWLRVDNAKAVTSNWTVVVDSGASANHLLQVGTLSDDTFEVGGNSTWTDQAVEVRVKPTSTSGYVYVAARYAGVNSYYYLQLQAGSKPKIRARTNIAGSSSTTDVCAGTVAAGTAGTWSTVVVTAKGTTISAMIDGTAVCSGTNADIPAGGVALGSDGVQVFFDDLSVSLPP